MSLHSKIVSKDNSLIKQVVRLSSDSKFRQQEQLAVVYGEHLVEEAISSELLDKIFIQEEYYERYEQLLNRCKNIAVYLVNDEVMSKLNVLDSTVNIVATIKIKPVSINKQINDVLILENIQDPGNLGTILRAARASGIDDVVISKNSVDIYNPKVLRASQGIQFNLKIINNANLIEFLSEYDGDVFALTPHADASLYEQDLTKPCAFVLGNEGNGLSAEILEYIQHHIRIPMMGSAESLNLAMAATVAMFEMSRQRLKV